MGNCCWGTHCAPTQDVHLPPMLKLDTVTLLTLASVVYVLAAALMMMAALYGRHDRTLFYTAAGWVVAGSAGFVINLAPSTPSLARLAIWIPNAVLLASYGFLWAGLRTFVDKSINWTWIVSGVVIWLLLCLWPTFMHTVALRVTVFSVIVLLYMLVTLYDLWPARRSDNMAVAPVLFFLVLNALFYAYRAIPVPATANTWMARPDMAVTILGNIVFVLGISFSVLIMVRERTEQQYLYASRHDALTGLFNRRALFDQGTALLSRATTVDAASLGALMCDLDWFKQVNDQHGHSMGDAVLTAFANLLRELTPDNGVCARLGGEEFLMLVPDQPDANVGELAERLRARFQDILKPLPSATTVSIGVSFARAADHSLDRLLIRADQALYAAKAAGRNCVKPWSPALTNVQPSHSRARTQ